MQFTYLFIREFLRVYHRLLHNPDLIRHVCFHNKSLGNWQGDQRMKSVIWRVVCMDERLQRNSPYFPGSNIKSYSFRPYFGDFFIQTTIWKETSSSPHQDLLVKCHSILRWKMIVFSSKLDSSHPRWQYFFFFFPTVCFAFWDF